MVPVEGCRMGRRRAATSEQSDGTSIRAWVVTAVAGLSLFAVLVAGSYTRDAVRNWDRYTMAFSDIDCEAPSGEERLGFLAEVQYLSGMPSRLSVLDEDLGRHIADA